MNISKPRTIHTILFLAFTLALTAVTPLVASRVQSQGKTDSFEYSIQGDKDQSVYVTVGVNMDDEHSRQKYIDANKQRGYELIANKQNEHIPVQITFASPISIHEVRKLVESTNFDVEEFLLVGHSTISQERGTHIQFSSLDVPIPERELIDPNSGEEIVFEGIMVLKGQVVATNAGLGKWLADERVYLVDTSKVELLEILGKEHMNKIAGKEVEISIPSPFWNLDW